MTAMRPTVPSPCVNVCVLDPASGYCQGCGRTGEEIADWRAKPEAVRRAVWQAIPGRLAELGVGVRPLPWGRDDITAFVKTSLESHGGTWLMGCHGGVGEFATRGGEGQATRRPVTVTVTDRQLTARTAGAAMALAITPSTRAWAMTRPDRPDLIALTTPRLAGAAPGPGVLTDLGPDPAPLHDAAPGARLYDFGLARDDMRFCVRADVADLRAELDAAAGTPFPDHMTAIAHGIFGHGPVRVITTGLGRMEVTAPIPAPGGRSPDGPHTHLLPDLIALGRATPPGMDLPRDHQLGALFYPAIAPAPA